MARYHCKNEGCSETAISKCALSRTVFPNNQMGALLTHFLKRNVIYRGDHTVINLRVTMVAEDGKEPSVPEAVRYALDMIRELDQETVDDYCCDHVWVIDEGKCMFGCCVAA